VGVVLDTSALVAFERADRDWDALLVEYGSDGVAIPAIVLAELRVGALLAEHGQRVKAAKIESLMERANVVEFGREIAELWADIFAALRRQGQGIPANDIAVAATAMHLGSAVVVGHEDEKHFRRIPGLHIDVLTV
jgi:predicted nucleic acid-binding protein